MGTDGLDQATNGMDDVPGSTLLRLPNMYSRFRPLPYDYRDAHVRNYRAIRRTMNFFMYSEASAGTPGTSAITAAKHRDHKGAAEDDSPPLVSYDVYLDESELFSQLCTVTNLVKTGPRRGLFLSCANINHGVIRVWRDWLSRRNDARTGEQRGKGKGRARVDLADPKQDAVLWAYTGKHVGMRFRVTETTAPSETAAPVLGVASDDLPISYQLEYEGVFHGYSESTL